MASKEKGGKNKKKQASASQKEKAQAKKAKKARARVLRRTPTHNADDGDTNRS